MKSQSIFTFFLLCSLLSFGQDFSVSGTVIDAQNNPIEFANVVLFNEDESEVLKGTSSNETGFFDLSNLEAKTYVIKVSYIGFKDFTQKIILAGALDIQTIILLEDSEQLDEISIIAQKPTIKREADRLIFNIEKTALVEGNMLQVLKSTPGVLVIGDEITVKNSNPTVYINNRKVNLSSNDLNQLLSGSSANAIKSVEVITNPSARYDAESGVVINIVMSKNLITGYRGSVFTSFTQGVFPRYNAGTSHFFKNENISLNVNYSYSKDKINRSGDDTVNFLNNANTLNESWRSATNRNTWSETHNLNTNFDYFIDENNTLSVSSNILYLPYFKYSIDNNTVIRDLNGDFSSRFTADNLSRDVKHNLAFDLDFNHGFKKGDLAINAHYTTYNYERDQGVISNFFDDNNTFVNSSAFNTNNNQDTNIIAGKADYSLPLNDSSNFETGLKFSSTNTESNITQFDVDLISGNETIDAQNSDAFNYDEQIYAAYANYDLSTEKWSINAGLRLEQTNIIGNSPLTNISNTQDYLEWFPNASLQYKIKEDYNVYSNYKRSIARPSYAALNPFRFFLNDNYVVSGNPFLVPTFTNHFVVGANITDYFTFEAYYKNFDGAISEIPRQDNEANVIEYISVNFDKTVDFGFDFITNFDISNRWKVYAVTSFYNFQEEANFGQGFVRQDQWSNYSELQNDFTLLKDNSLNISFVLTWVGKNLQGFQIVENRLFSDLAISKTVFNKQGVISLSVSDLFNMQDTDSNVRYQNQFSTQYVDLDNRFVRLGFRYKFGNTKLNSNARAIDSEERDRLEKKEK